jgi:hypothetical protein
MAVLGQEIRKHTIREQLAVYYDAIVVENHEADRGLAAYCVCSDDCPLPRNSPSLMA